MALWILRGIFHKSQDILLMFKIRLKCIDIYWVLCLDMYRHTGAVDIGQNGWLLAFVRRNSLPGRK